MNHITDNQDALLDYLYEEGDPTERLTIARHLQECAACAVAVLEFQNVRSMLSDWAPPASRLGFRMVQDADASSGAKVTSPSASITSPSVSHDHRTRGGWSWGWGRATTKESSHARSVFQAAAAILVFVSGMAVSQLSVDYQGGVLRVRMRSTAEVTPAANPGKGWITLPPERAIPGSDEIVRRVLAALEGQNVSSADTEGLIQRVRSMIDQSEQRQQRELALRLSQVAREVETQHQYDVQRIEQNIGQQQDATMDYLVRTSGGTK